MRLEHPCGDDVDRSPEQPLQLPIEGGEIEQVGAGLEVDEQVDVAGLIVLAVNNASEDADVAGLMRMCEGNDLVAMPDQLPAER